MAVRSDKSKFEKTQGRKATGPRLLHNTAAPFQRVIKLRGQSDE
jgi:hypothetical protein